MNAIFQEAIWPMLIIGQFFGIMPVVGVKNRSSSHLRFEWARIRTFHSLAIGTALISYALLSTWKAFTTPFEFFSTIGWSNWYWAARTFCIIQKNVFPFQPPWSFTHWTRVRSSVSLCWLPNGMNWCTNGRNLQQNFPPSEMWSKRSDMCLKFDW